MVELLLGKGVDINAQGGFFGDALQTASVGGHEMVEPLDGKGTIINAQGGQYGNPLQVV